MRGRLPSLAGAPLVWLGHFAAVYVLATLACALPQRLPLAPAAVTVVGVAGLTVAAVALAATGLLRNWRRLRAAAPGAPEAFLAQANVLLYAMALGGIGWVALPGLLLPACQ